MRIPLHALPLVFFLSAAAGAGSLPANGDFRSIISNAKAKVFPSVVFLMPIAERFDAGRREKEQVAGSGVIISEDGEVVTNWHVVNKAVEIRCLLFDGSICRASVVGADKDSDLALLKLDGRAGGRFPAAELGDSDRLEEGEFVMAMGAPWGLSRSVSLGILSCVRRFLPGQGGNYNLWLQTDASINPGNSGGPLVDSGGRVIGINTLGSLLGGNLAFAIPSSVVRKNVEHLRRSGRVVRAWTGLGLQPLRDFERDIFYDGDEGVLVAGVDPGSPAAAAGIRTGDLLLAVGGEPVRGLNHEDIPGVNQALAELPIGEEVVFEVSRGRAGGGRGETTAVAVRPEEKGKVEGDDFDCRRWNMTVKAVNEFSTPMLHFFDAGGVYVQAVKYPGNAQAAGLRNGDVILELDGIPVRGLDDCERLYNGIVADGKRDRKVFFTVMRAGLKNYHVLDYAPQYGQD